MRLRTIIRIEGVQEEVIHEMIDKIVEQEFQVWGLDQICGDYSAAYEEFYRNCIIAAQHTNLHSEERVSGALVVKE